MEPTKKEIKKEKIRVRTLKAKINKNEERKLLFAQLAKTQLDPTQSDLLRKTSTLGQKESARDALTRAFRHQKAGIATDDIQKKSRIDTEVKLSTKISEDAQIELNKLVEMSSVPKKEEKTKRKRNKKKHTRDVGSAQKKVEKSTFFSKDIDSDDEREKKRQKKSTEESDSEEEFETDSGSEEEEVAELNMPNTIKINEPTKPQSKKAAPAPTSNKKAAPPTPTTNKPAPLTAKTAPSTPTSKKAAPTTPKSAPKPSEAKPAPVPAGGSWISGLKFDRVIPKKIVEEEEEEEEEEEAEDDFMDDEDGEDDGDSAEYAGEGDEEESSEEDVDMNGWDLGGFVPPKHSGKFVRIKPPKIDDSEGEEETQATENGNESAEEDGEGEGEDRDEEEEGENENGEDGSDDSDEIEVRPNPFAGILEQKEEYEADKNAKKFHVFVDRTEEISNSRGNLPIIMEEHAIMETIEANDVVIICGETGSGKTTQVPQFLYEAGFGNSASEYPGMIGITQPRRVAAVSMALRVEKELNLEGKGKVGYQIRYDKTVDKSAQVKFMTDGILMKEVQSDFLLSRYSAIIIDEAHERNVNTDILIGFLSRIVPLRRKMWLEQKESSAADKKVKTKVTSPLKLIIMSATLRVEDFTGNTALFKEPPPVLNISARQFPVTVHFNKKTETDYLGSAFKKVSKIHRELPEGGILVFVTGQHEVEGLCKKLRTKFGKKQAKKQTKEEVDGDDEKVTKAAEGELSEDENDGKLIGITKSSEYKDGEANGAENENKDSDDDSEEEGETKDLNQLRDDYDPNDPEEEKEDKNLAPLYILPLYSALPTAQQLRVFKPPPEGSRLVVVATNVAETSLTIPNIRYVVDTGKAKARQFEKVSGISTFVVEWTSKASADQRAGRAGRTGPGHCYRLYSSAVFNDTFKKFSEPEILLLPIDGILLQMKTMNIARVLGFPFPTPPDQESVKAAVQTLTLLEALDNKERITDLGRTLSQFPLNPRFSKMLVKSRNSGCMQYVIALVAALSVHDPLLRHKFSHNDDEGEKEEVKSTGNVGTDALIKKQKEKELRSSRRAAAEKAHRRWAHPQSDLLAMLKAVGAYEHEFHLRPATIAQFCEENYLLEKSMKEIHQLRQQLTAIVNSVYPDDPQFSMDTPLRPPDDKQQIYLRQILATGLIDQVARLAPTTTMTVEGKKTKRPYQIVLTNEQAYIHPSSYLSNIFAEYVVFTEIIVSGQSYMQSVTAINPAWLPTIGVPMLGNFKISEQPVPHYDPKTDSMKCVARVSYGPHVWELPAAEVNYPEVQDKYKWFARELLEGSVFPILKHFTPFYEAHPMLLTKSFGHVRIVSLLHPLVEHKIDSKEKLVNEWAKDPKFLLNGVAAWVKDKYRQYLPPMWPPIDSQKVPPGLLQAYNQHNTEAK